VSSLVFNERNAQQTKQQTKQNTKTTNDKKPLVSSSSSTLNSYVANNNFHTAVWLAACLKSTSMSRDSAAAAEILRERERERESASANEMEGANCLTVFLGQKDDARCSIPRR
jgi:hypothetical protein